MTKITKSRLLNRGYIEVSSYPQVMENGETWYTDIKALKTTYTNGDFYIIHYSYFNSDHEYWIVTVDNITKSDKIHNIEEIHPALKALCDKEIVKNTNAIIAANRSISTLNGIKTKYKL